jgi:outer membrane protein assembly factor BamB
MRKVLAVSLAGLLAVPPVAAVLAGNWPGWRGPDGSGVTADAGLPTEWGRDKNVRWRVDLPGPGNASPVVWGEKVFVAQAVAEVNRRTLMCFDRPTGKLLWQSGVAYADKEPTHDTNLPCGGTPAVDGERVYVCFGSAGVVAYDLAGKELWRRDLGKLNHMFGNAVSPVLHGDLCILNFGPDMARARLVALKKATGEVAWEARPPADGAGMAMTPGGPGMGIMLAGTLTLAADANHDEAVTKAEFAALADDWFAKLDGARAGKLSSQQFAGGLDKLLPPAPGMAGPPADKTKPPGPPPPMAGFTPGTVVGPGLFAAADADKNGSLTRDEFVASANRWAVEWDADKDGKLDENEIRDGLNAVLPAFSFGPPPGPAAAGDGKAATGDKAAAGKGAGDKPTDKAAADPTGGMGPPDGSWATPVIVKTDGRDELVVGFARQLAAYDPATGKLLWTCRGLGSQVYTSALAGDGLVVALSSGMEGGAAIAVRPGGTGDVTATRLAWKADRIKGAIGSGVLHGGRLYHAGADGVAECFDARTGKKLWQKRLAAAGERSGVWSSALLAGDRIYLANQGGEVFVLRAGPAFELLATNSVGELTNASPAAADGELFLRTDQSLWCFGSPR